jgi:hypothetical protein
MRFAGVSPCPLKRKPFERRFVVSRFENPAQFDTTYPNVAPTRGALATFLLLAALLAYAGGFMVLYPLVANSVAESVSAGNDPALLQFVGL